MSTPDTPIPAVELVRMLSPSLGQQKAEALIVAAAEALNLRAELLARSDALRIMEKIADQPGLVGITARFAKSRVHLWSS
jgi:hypothetical protein